MMTYLPLCFLTLADGFDYIADPTDIVFPAGSARGDSQCAEIDIIDDEPVESRETFYVELSANDSRIEIFEVCRRIQVDISDNDCKLKLQCSIIFTSIILLLIVHFRYHCCNSHTYRGHCRCQ